ncbi:cell wall hydrolase [Sphingomonas guangdongensis]|nr:cell wall hydrolase [Sphingomonas guangdongensis]
MRRVRFNRQAGGAAAALLVSLAGVGFSAHAGLSRTPDLASNRITAQQDADEPQHFPGAALLYAEEAGDDGKSTTVGATGTVALPDLPAGVQPALAEADASIRPAAPFMLRGTTLDKARALQCLTTAIYYEAATEPDDGQAAVAQVILNRVRHPTFPGSVCGVVYQGSQRRGCQFSFACDGALARAPARVPWERARRAAARALAGQVFAPVGLATHYHTYAVTPAWNRSLVMTGMFGAHLFHRWKGWWGTPAAFTRSYVGGEPLPEPHAPAAPIQQVTIDVAVAARTAALLAATPPAPATVQPAHVESGEVRAAYAAPAESQILDRWKDSGKPLR